MVRRFLILSLLGLMASCATLQQVVPLQQVAALRRVTFNLGAVDNPRLAGVPLARIASYRDLSAADVARLALAAAGNELPLEFALNIRAENPADNRAAATMVRLGWTLLLDERETIRGVLDSSYAIPPGQTVTIPLRMRVDLRQYFDGGAEQLVNLAAGLVGASADSTRVALEILPRIDTPFGPMDYPAPIRVIQRSVGGRPAPAAPTQASSRQSLTWSGHSVLSAVFLGHQASQGAARLLALNGTCLLAREADQLATHRTLIADLPVEIDQPIGDLHPVATIAVALPYRKPARLGPCGVVSILLNQVGGPSHGSECAGILGWDPLQPTDCAFPLPLDHQGIDDRKAVGV